jgi:hypothetical protein
MQAQAMQFARLSPMQQAQYSLYMGGQQLGGAIGSALGGKDPQLQMIGLTQQIAQVLIYQIHSLCIKLHKGLLKLVICL